MLIVDRVAMTIHDSLAGAASPDEQRWGAMPEDEKSRYRIAATRVLGALRGPSHQMLADGNLHGAPSDAGNVWERMIFRALYEQEG